jgi:hypothetical protein
LNGLFLILKALSNFCENGIGICVLLFNVLHESVDSVLRLQSLLLDWPMLLVFQLEHS